MALWMQQPSMLLQTDRGKVFFFLSLSLHVLITVVIAIYPGYKKSWIGVEFFHPNLSKVKDQNMWVCSGHLGLLGTWRPWASDSHNILDHFIWYSLKSLYSQPHVHYCTNTRDATGLPKPHHSLPACNPQREKGSRERRELFSWERLICLP